LGPEKVVVWQDAHKDDITIYWCWYRPVVDDSWVLFGGGR
jgi:hypothetical protein